MQRNRGYRKPVPVYIPSPPSSPCIPTIHSSVEEKVEEVPPLPDNWRDILHAKILEGKSSRMDVTGPTLPAFQDETPSAELDITELASSKASLLENTNVNVDGDQDSLTIPPSCGNQSSIHKQQTRGLPTQYRPPTPPLPSQSKRQKMHSEKTEDVAPFSDLRRLQGIYPPGLYPNGSRALAGDSLLRIKPSFRTEKTMVSLNPGPSAGWPYGLGTFSDGRMHSYPTLFKNQTADVVTLSDDGSDSSSGISCWRALEMYAKKFRGLAFICK